MKLKQILKITLLIIILAEEIKSVKGKYVDSNDFRTLSNPCLKISNYDGKLKMTQLDNHGKEQLLYSR
ncbi:hypothetical protein [Mammaliicoccus lentus]|uniref:hypothetical protein n=1 Tax=Mammaliicoccus lentus TaxID=42858 RepID=UPI003A598FAF